MRKGQTHRDQEVEWSNYGKNIVRRLLPQWPLQKIQGSGLLRPRQKAEFRNVQQERLAHEPGTERSRQEMDPAPLMAPQENSPAGGNQRGSFLGTGVVRVPSKLN
jgi:hypothetical protein